jgi:hypothetical protein
MHLPVRRTMLAVLLPLCCGVLTISAPARADDTPSPCNALKRIIAASPNFSSLTAMDGRPVALPYGEDAQCASSQSSYHCTWTPRGGSGADALQGVAADIASCLPDATHDQNSPARQHFYLGPRGARTEITAAQAGSNKLKLEVSGSH